MFGTYVESFLDPTGLDWVMGDNIPFTVRDLENTTRDCFTEVENLTSVHDRGEALGHWFFLCVNGNAGANIPPMDIDEVIALVFEALPNLGTNPDYQELMQAVISLAITQHGPCSNQVRTIVRAWETICVPTGHRFATPNIPCGELTGPNWVCEESNQIQICLSGATGINTTFGRWTIIGTNSTSYLSVNGMQGNSQNGGSCLHIYKIPDMPYYPQTITIQYWHSTIGQTLTKKVRIRDCDGDDPTCKDYYDLAGRAIENDSQDAFAMQSNLDDVEFRSKIKEQNLKLKVFDMMGNLIGLDDESLYQTKVGYPQILIVTYWDEEGRLVSSKKVCK
jgi:hypothetical protein